MISIRQARRISGSWAACHTGVALVWLSAITPASADKLPMRTYDADQGLTSLGGACMVQDKVGYVLVCTEHGVFSFDGRRFSNLGTDQGLRSGGEVVGIAVMASGRIAINFADEVFVSDRPSDSAHAPTTLTFSKVLHPGISFYANRPRRIAAGTTELAFLAGDRTYRLAPAFQGRMQLVPMPYAGQEAELLKSPIGLFAVQGRFWETFDNGRICAADPGSVRCYGPADGLVGGPWSDVIMTPAGAVMARSPGTIATLDSGSGKWSITALPDQGGRYVNYAVNLGLFRTPDGNVITQAEHGLVVQKHGTWQMLTTEDGAPAGTINSAVTDDSGHLWFQVLGQGLTKWIGYGHWEAVEKSDGLSEGLPWRTARAADGALWISTDTGVDEATRHDGTYRVDHVYPGPSFAVAVGPHGNIWRGRDGDGPEVLDPVTRLATRISSPPVNTIIVGDGNTVWLGTERGLFKVDDAPDSRRLAVLAGAPGSQVPDLANDGSGGVFYLASGRLRHLHADGIDAPVRGPWPDGGFDPFALAIGHNGEVWVGGAGGLYTFMIADDTVTSMRDVPVSATRTNSIVALMVDHRGWVWVGTARGVSIFNGTRWISVDSDTGLLSDDVDQGGLREDPDGSVWITTTKGVSHVIDPDWLFTKRPVQALVSSAKLGNQTVNGTKLAYSTDALDLQFGSPSHGAMRSFSFRYRLSGVDSKWEDSTTGIVHYPSVPPGRHVLTVLGYDELIHAASLPATLVVSMEYPWWRQWSAEALWVCLVIAAAIGLMRLRFHTILARQAELTRLVAEGTEQLRHQVAHDSLTGLLNRYEVERRLAKKLSGPSTGSMIVALMDLDHFKQVNDHYGHLGGDDVLRTMGRIVRTAVRKGEYAGRYGGEEILLVIDGEDGNGTERVLGLHQAVRNEVFVATGQELHVTCSIGLALAVNGDDWESIIGRADQALYQAKAAGRDRVVEYDSAQTVIMSSYVAVRSRHG